MSKAAPRRMGAASYQGKRVKTKLAVTFPNIFDFFFGHAYNFPAFT